MGCMTKPVNLSPMWKQRNWCQTSSPNMKRRSGLRLLMPQTWSAMRSLSRKLLRRGLISVVKNKVDKAIDDALPTNTAEVVGPEEPSKKVLSPPPSEEAAPTELTEKLEGIEEIPATEAPAGSIDDDFQEKTSPAQMRWDLLKIILCLSSLCIALVWACASCIRTWERRQALKSVYQEISGYPNYRTAVNGKKYKARNAACTPPVEALTPEHSPRDLSVDQV